MAAATSKRGRRPKYNCLFCNKGIAKRDLWKVDVYPRHNDAELEASTFRACTGCSRSLFDTLLERLTEDGKVSDGAGKRYCCLYCEREVASGDIWTIEAYPSQRNPEAAGEMVRVCETCVRAFYAVRDEVLADMAA